MPGHYKAKFHDSSDSMKIIRVIGEDTERPGMWIANNGKIITISEHELLGSYVRLDTVPTQKDVAKKTPPASIFAGLADDEVSLKVIEPVIPLPISKPVSKPLSKELSPQTDIHGITYNQPSFDPVIVSLVSKYVQPSPIYYNTCIPIPFDIEKIQSGMVMLDLSSSSISEYIASMLDSNYVPGVIDTVLSDNIDTEEIDTNHVVSNKPTDNHITIAIPNDADIISMYKSGIDVRQTLLDSFIDELNVIFPPIPTQTPTQTPTPISITMQSAISKLDQLIQTLDGNN